MNTKTKALKILQGFPSSHTQEILWCLITKGRVSIMDFPYLSGFRTRVSELNRKHGLGLKTNAQERTSKFGNTFVYHVHILPKEQVQKAIELYEKLSRQ